MKGTVLSHICPIQKGTAFPCFVKVGVGILWIVALLQTASAQTKFEPVRINCGGSRYVDTVTKFVWINDSTKFVTQGTQVSRCSDRFLTISNTTKSMREIYCSNRSFKPSSTVQPNLYSIPVLNATASYIVRLHFAELNYRARGARKMDVLIGGIRHLRSFDIVSASGFQTAFVYQTPSPVTVTKGVLNIQFNPVQNNAIISGIEVLAAQLTTAQPTSSPKVGFTSAPIPRAPVMPPFTAPVNFPITTKPTKVPTKRPTSFPTKAPVSKSPTSDPTKRPTSYPTKLPVTFSPTKTPTKRPTSFPTSAPVTKSPTYVPTKRPTPYPTKFPVSLSPTSTPTKRPSSFPTTAPVTKSPTTDPTKRPTSYPTRLPVTLSPTKVPTKRPTSFPTKAPVTKSPTSNPTKRPTSYPTRLPVTLSPTEIPTKRPTPFPTKAAVTKSPTDFPTKRPTSYPTKVPVTNSPTNTPTTQPTSIPTKAPIQESPSDNPSKRPTTKPTNTPVTHAPTRNPITDSPTKRPTRRPSFSPAEATESPANKPTKAQVTNSPTKPPTIIPTNIPTQKPISTTPFVYYRNNNTNILGVPDFKVGIGNPLKGLAGGPRWSQQSPLPNSVPSAIEFYNLALDEIMVGDNQFDWTLHDRFLSESASRKMHAVISVFIDWPGRPLRLPPHLKNLTLYTTSSGGTTPHYGDTRLLTAFRQFIYAWSVHVDGDTRVAALHVGLLGFWGEGHTYPDDFVPESSKVAVAQWYRDAFNRTQIQTRYPGSNAVGFGLYDGSLAYNTLDGAANGGVKVGWFQYPRMVSSGQTNIWKEHMMGGETRPELQGIIFTDTYPARTENHQDYKECIDALHLSYAVHHGAFQNGGYTGNTLANANNIHAYMGYAFYVSDIAASTSSMTNAQAVNVSVAITQLGVAPFYYDLSLVLTCDNGLVRKSLPGVNEIVQKGDSRTFTFTNVPATSVCLQQVQISLDSSYAYSGRPILFAQGSNGEVNVNIPLPSDQQTLFVRRR